MTASKENLGGVGKTSKVISSTLAGVLAVGMIPAAGFAAEAADEGTSDADIEVLNTSVQALMNGAIQLRSGQSDGQSFSINDNPNALVGMGVIPQGDTDVMTIDEIGAISGNTGAAWYYMPVATTGGTATPYYNNGKQLNVVAGQNLTLASSGITAPGTYALVVAKNPTVLTDSDDPIVKNAPVFTVTGKSLKDATIFEVAADGSTSDTSFVYNGDAWDFGYSVAEGKNILNFVVNGTALTSNDINKVTVYDSKGIEVDYSNGNLEYAGTYRIAVSGKGDYETQTAEFSLTISPLDLSKANVVYAGTTTPTPAGTFVTETEIKAATTTVNGSSLFELGLAEAADSADPADYYISASQLNASQNGVYTVTFAPDIPASVANAAQIAASFTGTASGQLAITTGGPLDSDAFEFNGNTIGEAGSDASGAEKNAADTITIDYSLSNSEVDPITGKYNKWNSDLITVTSDGKAVSDSAYTIQVLDENNNNVGIAGLANKGTYKLSVIVDPANTTPAYAFSGTSATMTVNVTYGDVSDADVAWSYKGENLDNNASAKIEYTGSAIEITPNVIYNGKTLSSSDYSVVIKKGNQVVDQILDVGDYTLTVTSDKYTIASDAVQNIEVTPLTFDYVRISPSQVFGKDMFLNYTGSDINLQLEYTTDGVSDTQMDEGKLGANTTWTPVPEGIYDLTYKYSKTGADDSFTTPVDAINKVGYYQITMTVNPSATNYAYTGKVGIEYGKAGVPNPEDPDNPTATPYSMNYVVYVSDDKVYLDVPSDSWAANWAYLATTLDYMHGYNNSEFFGPFDSMKRGDVALVLYRMSLPQDKRGDTFGNANNADQSYNTPFTDVDPHAYNAQAIQWASQTGIVTGYAGTTDFGPNDPVTREQFATMLARFAAKAGTDTGVEDVNAVLGKYTDGANVADWAKDAVAWACENKIMGANDFLWPSSDIERAAIAKMTVVYQPEDQEVLVNEILNSQA